ncbi:NAD-dependent epimerase/dehydratase family protein [Plantactinospora sp. KLBMP9567]|uniref:NAD-dependent epimerase/dehydratase family protein n=1 Tax=Plantactinospora sp. KLBMP9567 TaxID=3085900 RepID=UPI002980C541|nr:NAD-dependent epimerase/dehydratase family protein [Plantactinospora sp. KLBMP9567]MDW5324868.1 NAD-dependent epimerase/dehydratase family protein [Plantactinospora sp. KLBMP9567]
MTGGGYLAGRRVTVTGGASFIGSHLCEALVAAGAVVRVADDFSSGSMANLDAVARDVEIRRLDLRRPEAAAEACAGAELVFHLAAAHGGRGYIDSHPAACAENMLVDQHVFRAAVRAGVAKVVFASSACVYPEGLQRDVTVRTRLREDLVGPPYDPDGLYGMAKLCGELVLRSLAREHGIGAAVCRYFTAYGPRCGESHAIMAMIARAFVRADPFELWGDGEQIRTWIHVDDVVRMTLLAARRVDDGEAVNVATEEEHTVREAAEMVLRATGHRAAIRTRPEMPTGPLCRTADIGRARALLGYAPRVTLTEGIRRTVDWYFAAKERSGVAERLDALLVERDSAELA